MKTPAFWYPQSENNVTTTLRILLAPLSLLFRIGTCLRRVASSPYRARVPVICIGNVVAGGAGKTPTTLALAKLLKERGHKPVFVTRGHGGSRTRKSVIHIDPRRDTATDVGDEALLLASYAPTWAGRNRVKAIRQAESHGTVIIMDDGLQNPHVRPAVSILVIDGDVGVGNGRIIPAGPLRESLADGLGRVAATIILGETDEQNLAAQIKVPVFRAHLEPNLPLGFPSTGKFVAFAGIARPKKFYVTALAMGLEVEEFCAFPDHHMYTQNDIDNLRLRAEEHGARLLTTEKDVVRLSGGFRDEVITLPVDLAFDKAGAADELVRICLTAFKA
jgi:tetraacyldisaccharide 4'-kinase